MKSKNPNCYLHTGTSPAKRTSPGALSIDSRTAQAVQQLRFHAEEMALELAVRLRVLGKSLAAACLRLGTVTDKSRRNALAYQDLRGQLDAFLSLQEDRGLTGHPCFPVIRNYLKESLPYEVNGCAGNDPCRVERIETVIALLSENSSESYEFIGDPVISFSF